MADEIMMALGEYRFSLSTAAYEELRRSTNYRWASQERMGRLPARQFLGAGEDDITLSGTVYPHFKGGVQQIETMRLEAEKGQPLILVDGLGRMWGKWCITSIEETSSSLMSNGVPLKQDFRLQLKAYGDDHG